MDDALWDTVSYSLATVLFPDVYKRKQSNVKQCKITLSLGKNF